MIYKWLNNFSEVLGTKKIKKFGMVKIFKTCHDKLNAL